MVRLRKGAIRGLYGLGYVYRRVSVPAGGKEGPQALHPRPAQFPSPAMVTVALIAGSGPPLVSFPEEKSDNEDPGQRIGLPEPEEVIRTET